MEAFTNEANVLNETKEFTFNPAYPLLLVDWSYFCFHRFFSSFRWYKMQKENMALDPAGLHEDEVFVTAFKKHFHDNFKKILKQFRTVEGNIILLKDAPRATLWRMGLYPEYKGTRDKVRAKTPSRNINSNFFTIAEQEAEKRGFRFLGRPTLEADDLAYMVCDQEPTIAISLLSNDNDWIQIQQKHPHIVLQNMEGKNIIERGVKLVEKVIAGDCSDGIMPIFKKCGPKRCQVLAADPLALEQALIDNPSSRAALELNRLLIDMANIPSWAQTCMVLKPIVIV